MGDKKPTRKERRRGGVLTARGGSAPGGGSRPALDGRPRLAKMRAHGSGSG